ncbi:MAG: 6-carboxytetrahydropterin synthase QueD [Zetaproteobacteria bacterium]|nr:MAG: 6-carboxytetrahydropterin synthase QueD [Zetaproteobacteria bacterium]
MAYYELKVKDHFSAAHALRGYPGDCARLHGHNWHVTLYVRCERLDALGMGVDYKVLKKALKEALRAWDHYNLNDIPPFDRINPTSENVAAELWRKLAPRINREGVRISRVEIAETCTAAVIYWPEEP